MVIPGANNKTSLRNLLERKESYQQHFMSFVGFKYSGGIPFIIFHCFPSKNICRKIYLKFTRSEKPWQPYANERGWGERKKKEGELLGECASQCH